MASLGTVKFVVEDAVAMHFLLSVFIQIGTTGARVPGEISRVPRVPVCMGAERCAVGGHWQGSSSLISWTAKQAKKLRRLSRAYTQSCAVVCCVWDVCGVTVTEQEQRSKENGEEESRRLATTLDHYRKTSQFLRELPDSTRLQAHRSSSTHTQLQDVQSIAISIIASAVSSSIGSNAAEAHVWAEWTVSADTYPSLPPSPGEPPPCTSSSTTPLSLAVAQAGRRW